MRTVLADLRYAVRIWSRTPGLAAVALLTLALGIGANTTMFSVVNTVLLKPLPFEEPERLMTLWKGQQGEPERLNITSLPDFRDWKAASRSFASLAIFDSAGRGYNLGGAPEPEQVLGLRVTASFFDVLGVRPLIGRTFTEDEETPGRDRVVVLSHQLWTRRYGADPGIVGRTIRIDGEPFEVIGVMPPSFRFQFWSGPRQLWVPAGWTAGDQERTSNSFICIGRLRPGVTVAQARAEMDAIGRALAAAHPETNPEGTVRVVPVQEYGVSGLRSGLLMLLVVVGFVLLIACANIANLLLARAAVRHREFAVRSALGAGRGRLVRQLLTESVLLAVVGGGCGLIVAVWSSSLLAALLPASLRFVALRPLEQFELDGTVLLFAFVVSCLSGLLFGLAPAVASFRDDLTGTLKDGARGASAGRGRLRHALVASEIALAFVVLAGAGVMTASLMRLLDVDPVLDPENVLVLGMSVPQENLYYGPPGNPHFCQALAEHVGAVPGVVSVGAISHLPLSGGGAGRSFVIEGRDDPGPGNQPSAGYSVACPGFFETLGIPIVAGRAFDARDQLGAPAVVVVNETLAERYWPGEEAVGKRIRLDTGEDEPWLTVVGVARTFRHYSLDSDLVPWFWRPYPQSGWPVLSVVVKTASAPQAFERAIREAIAIVEPERPVAAVRTMEDVIGGSVSSRRFPMMLLTVFAGLALVLAAVGIAGVVGYSVVQRTQEIGVRMALGAEPRDVLRLVIGHSMRWAIGGLVAGLLVSLAVLRVLRAMLFGVEPTDPMVLGSVFAVLLLVALGASYLPARRAMRVNPVEALRV
ncbi:MAG TPA: ABC transporter permease [Vicinamibacterales bacterium]